MKLLPSLKQKRRYLAFQILASQKFSLTEIEEAVNQALTQFLGQLGLAQAAPHFLRDRFQETAQQGLIKINPSHVAEAKTALALIKKIKNTPVIFRSLTVSGTIKKANKKLEVSKNENANG